MGQITLRGNPGIDVLLRRSARARRISLRVSKLDGRVTLTLPKGVSEREALRFAEGKATWIEKALGSRADDVTVRIGSEIPVEGRFLPVVAGRGRSARVAGGALEAPQGREGPAAEAFLRHLARDRLAEAVDRHAGRLGRAVGRITLRDTRSRWGSCTSEGNLMFSWRLILAPAEVLDYVAAHEVAHLARMDHSPAFWAHVAALCPGYEPHRAWLRREGSALHRYRFS